MLAADDGRQIAPGATQSGPGALAPGAAGSRHNRCTGAQEGASTTEPSQQLAAPALMPTAGPLPGTRTAASQQRHLPGPEHWALPVCLG